MAWKWGYQPPISLELRKKILDSIKNDWISVQEAAKEYNVKSGTIHTWLNRTTESIWWNNNRELQRLKKDKEDLLLIIWELTAELNKTKKKK